MSARHEVADEASAPADQGLSGRSASARDIDDRADAVDIEHAGDGLASLGADGPQASTARGGISLPIGETVRIVGLALLMFLAFRTVGHTYVVSGASMEPTFHDAEMVVVNRLAYRSFDLSWLPGVDTEDWRPFGTPQRGDVVVFQYPNNPERDFIKRVIGVPGDIVEVHGGQVLVNGVDIQEPYLQVETLGDFPATLVPDGHLFVLGDNRNNSSDSRSWGMLPQSLVIGRADVRYWPPEAAGLIDHADLPAAGEPVHAEVTPSP